MECIRERIESAKQRSGRTEDVEIVAVTKGVDAGDILSARRLGVSIFGENRVQEALPKINKLNIDAEWHFIGHLQRNKVKDVIGNFSLIQSLDSLRLAREIEKRACHAGIKVDALLQVNASREETKFGLPPEEAQDFLRAVAKFGHLRIKGLMTMAPFAENPEEVRFVFRDTKTLFDRVSSLGLGNVEMKYLSMGMSADFEVAVEEGANMVRIGTAIFRG